MCQRDPAQTYQLRTFGINPQVPYVFGFTTVTFVSLFHVYFPS